MSDPSGPSREARDQRMFVLGMGCERATPPDHLYQLAQQTLRDAGIEAEQLASIASIDMKRHEPAILELAERYAVPVHFFDAATLERETPRLMNPSALVYSRVGCHGVAEAAALAAAGETALLIVGKTKSAFATAAVARIHPPAGCR